MGEVRTLEEWERLHDIPKSIFGWPDWRTLPPKRSRDAAIPLESQLATREVLLVTLADGLMNVLEDLQLRIMVWKGRPDFDVTATLEAEANGWTCISRMDFWPPTPHRNEFWRKLGQSPVIEGCHHHRFHDNHRLGIGAFKPSGNLPSAIQFDADPSSFRDILALIERHWNIDGASQLALPQGQGRLW